jgi:hypothetical protein
MEERLRSWSPRQPSSAIKRRLFPKLQPERAPHETGLGWVLPIAACAVGALLLLQIAGGERPARGAVPFFAMIGSNTVSKSSSTREIMFASADVNLQWNVWDRATFHWTNEHLWTSSMGSLQLAKTNQFE